MAIGPVQISVGKLSTRSPKFPSESGYVESIRNQFRDLQSKIADIYRQIEDATPNILLDALRPTFVKSQVYCPYLTGALRNSGYLEVTEFRGSPRVEIGYARGGNPYYASYVHEMVEIYRKPPTRPKWLQAAVMEDLPQIWGRLQASYSVLMKGP